MPFDPSTAKPVDSTSSFDPSTAKPYEPSLIDRAKTAVGWNTGRDIAVQDGVTRDASEEVDTPKTKRNIRMENSIMRGYDGMRGSEQSPEVSALPSVQKATRPALQFERQKDANRQWLDDRKPFVVDQLSRDNNLSPEDAEVEFARMRAAGVIPKATETGLREATWSEAAGSSLDRVKPSFNRAMSGIASAMSDATGDYAMGQNAEALRMEANRELAAAQGRMGGTEEGTWKNTIGNVAPSLAQNLPGLLLTAATKNPVYANLGLAGMGASTFGDSYAEGKDLGLNGSNNAQQALLKAAAEVGPEKLSLNSMMRLFGKIPSPGDIKAGIAPLAKEFAKQQGVEHATEQMTTAMQAAVDKLYTNPDLTLGDWGKQVAETFRATAIQGPLLAGAGMATNVAANAARKAYDPLGYELQGYEQAVNNTNFAPLTGGVGQDTDASNAARQSALNAWSQGFNARPAPRVPKTPEQILTDYINGTGDLSDEQSPADQILALEGSGNSSNEVDELWMNALDGNGNAAEVDATGNQGQRSDGVGSDGNLQSLPGLDGRGSLDAGTPVAGSGTNQSVGSPGGNNGAVNETSKAQTNANAGLQTTDPNTLPERSVKGSQDIGRSEILALQSIGRDSGAQVEIVSGTKDGVEFNAYTVGRSISLNTNVGAMGLVTMAHEIGHVIENTSDQGAKEWGGFESVVLDEAANAGVDLRSDAGLLAYAQQYAPQFFKANEIAMMRAQRMSDADIIATIAKRIGRNYDAAAIRAEFAKDVFGNAMASKGFMSRVAKRLAKENLPALAKMVETIDGFIAKLKGARKQGQFSGLAQTIAQLERVRDEAAKVYADHLKRARRMETRTIPELFVIARSNPDADIRDAAQAEIKRRETEAAYAQREQQATAEGSGFAAANRQARMDQIEAAAVAAGQDAQPAGAMQSALSGAKRDAQADRRAQQKADKQLASTARGNAKTVAQQLNDNEEGRYSPKRASSVERTLGAENNVSVTVGGKPGEFGWAPSARMAAALEDEMTKAEKLPGASLPPFIAPAAYKPNLELIGESVRKVLSTKAARDVIRDVTGANITDVVQIHGSWEQKAEPSFVLSGEVTFEQANDASKMLGFLFAQDSAVAAQPWFEETEGQRPAVLISQSKRLSSDQIKSLHKAASEAGLDYSTTVDGRGAKFLYFGEDTAGYFQLRTAVENIAKAAAISDVTDFFVRSELNESKDYLSGGVGKALRGEGDKASTSGPSDLFRRAVDHLLVPYIKAVGAEGYRFSADRYGDRFGLTEAEVEYIRTAVRPKNGKLLSTAPIVSGKEKVETPRTNTRAKIPGVSKFDLAWGMQNRTAKIGLIDPADRSEEASKIIADALADEVTYALNQEGGKSAVGWYDRALHEAKNRYEQVFPELRTDPDREMLFDAILGITSQGNDVHSNALFAGRVYYLMTRDNKTLGQAVEVLTGTFGKQTVTIENNLAKLEALIDRNGYDEMRKFFNTRATVSEFKKILKTDKTLVGQTGETLDMDGAAEQVVTGWMVFGPKIGSFINNLHGDYSTLTADLWFSRTWNRVIGFSFGYSPETESAQYVKLYRAMLEEVRTGKGLDVVKMTEAEVRELASDPRRMLAAAEEIHEKREAEYKKVRNAAITPLRQAAKNIVENRNDTQETPRGPTERAFQQKTIERVQRQVRRKTGVNLTIADIQAVLWYHEKNMYRNQFGVGDSKAEAADYVDAAQKFIDRYDNGDLFYVEKPSPRYIRGKKGDYLDGNQGQRFSPSRSDVAGDEWAGGSDAEASSRVDLPEYGQAAPGAVSAVGRHYSAQQRSSLDGRYYGTGANGREAERVRASRDPRIKERIYFYVDAGRGITPEQNVGSHAHDIRLNNLYDANADTWLQARVDRGIADRDEWMNAFESAVIDNGFDGYVSDFGTQRAAVLLGRHNVKPSYVGVNPLKTPGKAETQAAKPKAQTNAGADAVAKSRVLPGGKMSGADWKRMVPAVVPGADVSMLEDGKDYYKDDVVAAMRGVKFSLGRTINVDGVERPTMNSNGKPIAQTEEGLRNFWRWFGGSLVTERPVSSKQKINELRPMVVYHGTRGDFDAFAEVRQGNVTDMFGDEDTVTRRGIFFAENADFATTFANQRGEGAANVMPVYLDIKNAMYLDEGFTDEYIEQLEAAGFPDAKRLRHRKATMVWAEFDDEAGEQFISAAKRAGYDGVYMEEEGVGLGDDANTQAVWVAFNPTQIKSATGNRGTFDGSNPDIRYSTARNILGNQINGAWESTEVTGFDNVVRQMQDKLVDTKRVVQAIKAQGSQVVTQFDPYKQEILFHGRAAKRVHDFADGELRPLLQDMMRRKVEMAELENYLWARHAVERNAQIAKVNPNMPDGGSGLTNQQARDVMAGRSVTVGKREVKIDPAKMQHYAALAQRIDTISNETLNQLVAYGLETQETVDAWRNAYKYYVPLNRDLESDDNFLGAFNLGLGTGQGFSVRGSSSRRAQGSGREVTDILANLAMQRERAIVKGEKNRVSMATYGLALKSPNPDFWLPINPDAKNRPLQDTIDELVRMGLSPMDAQSIAMEPKQRYVDPRTGMVTERINPALRNRADVLAVRVNGQDRFLLFSNDQRAQEMVRNLKNLDSDQLGRMLQTAATVTRWFASVNTQYNPVFGIVNGIRDAQSALLNLGTTPIAGKKAKVMQYGMSALAGIYQDLRAHRDGKAPSSPWALEFEEFAKEGGQTGYRDMFQTSKARTDALTDTLKELSAGKVVRWFKINESNPIFAWLSDYNTTIENAFRLAAYKVAKEQGISKAEAALIAKNLTVNFNKKGLAATQTGALYAFFNSAVQGTARIGETMLEHRGDPSKASNLRLSKLGKKIVLGGSVLGVMQAVMFALAGYDDDEPKQFQREKNIIIPDFVFGSDKYVSIPMPLGFHVIPGTTRIMTEFALSGGKDPGKRLTQLLGLYAEAFNPIGSAGVSLQTLAPTIADPLVALGTNRDWNGQKVFKEDFNKNHPTPGWTRKKDSATPWAQGMAYGINWISGGFGPYERGLMSPTPDQIDYLIGQVTGGTGREISKLAGAAKSLATGEDLPMYKVPLAGRFIGETKGVASETGRYYENLSKIGEHQDPIKRMKADNQTAMVDQYIKDHPESKLVKLADHTSQRVSEIDKQRRKLIEKDAPREEVKKLEERKRALMAHFNRMVEKEMQQ